MPRTSPTTIIPEQAYQDFLQAITHAVNASNKAKQLKNVTNPNKLAIIKELITSITHVTKNFNIYATRLANDKLFLPLIEEFVFSFIAENLYELKKVVGNDYADLLGANSIGGEIRKIEIYLNEQIMQLQDYQHSLQLSDKARQLIIKWQKDPLKRLDWLGLEQYKKELITIQEQFKTYKTQLDPTKWLKPIVEFSKTLERIVPGTPLVLPVNPPMSVVQTANELELRKDVYALTRILNYFELATTVNLDKEPLGPTVIERALQIAGEYFKSTVDSPHLSPTMEQKLKDLKIPTNLIESLRNSLSHSSSFLYTLREEIKNNPNKLKLFKKVQTDLSKIKTVLTKIVYRINLKEIKLRIGAISSFQLTPEIQQIFSDIDTNENLVEIEAYLQQIIEKVDGLTTIGNDEKAAISSQIDSIRINTNLKQTAEYIRKLEAININQSNIETVMANLDASAKLERYNELMEYKRSHIIPSKSAITEAIEMPGLKAFPINLHSINFELSTTELFDLLVKEIFKECEDLYECVITEGILFEAGRNPDETLLRNEINRFSRENSLSFTPAEKDELVEKFKLFHRLASIKTNFLESLEEIKYKPPTTNLLNAMAKQAGLNSEQKALLKSVLFDLHQELFFNRLFETYFNSLLTEIQGKISNQDFGILKDKLSKQKKSHYALKKLSAFADNALTMSGVEYQSLVTDIIISHNKKTKLQLSYSNKTDIKRTLGSQSATPYEDLLNGIKNQEPIYDVLNKFKKFSNELNLSPTLKNQLDQTFKKNEVGRFQNLFLEKIHALNSLLALKENSNPIIKTSYEMALSDLTNLWKNLLKVADPVIRDKLALEHLLLDSSAIDKHFSLRSYLAHGDPLFDAINPNFIEQLIENIPQLVKEAKAWLALTKLMDDITMRDYLVNNVISQGRIDQLSAETLPSYLQIQADLLREYQQSPHWKEYLTIINPNYGPASPTAPIDQGKTLVKGLFEIELREAAHVNDLSKLTYCVQQGINIEASDKSKWSAIYYAIDAESYDTFEFLLDKSTRLDRLDSAGVSALHYMANNLDPRFANALVARGKWDEKINRGKWSLLQLAAIQNNPIVIDALIKNRISKVNAVNQQGFTALLAAVYFDHADLAEHLVTAHQANVLATTKKKFSVVHLTTINNNLALLQKLKQLDSNLALDKPLWTGWSAIHIAALKNLPNFLQYFIDNNVDANLSGKDGMTPLHIAAQEGHIASIEMLMKTAGVNPRTLNQHGSSALLTAVSNKQLATVEKILELDTTSNSIDQTKLINLADREGWSPLHVAVLQDNLEMTQFLLRKHAAVDQKKLNGIAASHIAAQHGYLEILKQLNTRRANFNELASHDWTVLHFASFYGHSEVIAYLLNLRTPLTIINSLTEDGFTALHLAVIQDHTDVTEELLKSSAIKTEINKKTKRTVPDPNNPANTIKIADATASHLAAKKGHLTILKKLADNGADLRLTGNEDWTHLHLAADAGHETIVSYFLNENSQVIDLEAKTKGGETALHRAALQGYSNIVDELLVHNANVRARTRQQATPLHLAARTGQLNVVAKLLQHAAQLEAKTNEGLTPLALATQYGQLNVVTDLLKRGANPLSTNNHDTVLHRATMSSNPEIIKNIIKKIKTQPAEAFEQVLNARDTEGDTPLIWAIQAKNPAVLEVLLQEGADFQLTNLASDTPFDIAVNTPYSTVDRSNKESVRVWKLKVAQQQKIIDLLYLKKYPSAKIQAMKDSFANLVNEEFRKQLAKLDFEAARILHDCFAQQGNISFWDSIAESVKKRIKVEHTSAAIDPITLHESPALQDLLRTVIGGVSLDKQSLNELYTYKAILANERLKETAQLHSSPINCQGGTRRKRKRAARLDCSVSEELEKFDPLLELTEKEKETITLLMASTQTPEQKIKLNENIINIQQIKAEGPLNQSHMELQKLDLFHKNLESAFEKKEQCLQKISDVRQAKLVKLTDYRGKSVLLSIHIEALAEKQHLSIYCPQINGYGSLQLNPDLPISKVLELYATLLFPDQATQSLSYEYYTILPNQLSTLSNPLESLTTSDFRSDKAILKSDNNHIEGIRTKKFRELFLINGEVPEIQQLHSNIFNDPEVTITFRSDKIVSKLWQMSPEQQTTLAAVINKYDILEEPSLVREDTLAVETDLQKFNRGFIEKLKKVTPETPITHAELTERSKQYLHKELLTEGFESHEIDKIINNVVDLHSDLNQGVSRAVGMTRQGIFLAPAIIQAMNGDTRGLNNLLMMMGGDMAIDHAYQALLSNAQFIERFPKSSGLLSKSVRYLASPIGKILLLDSFIELGKQMQENEPGSPKYQLAESLLADNSLFFATMVAEVIGLELGPAGILLDIGITIHQLMTTAKYYRDTLPFKISFWESIEVTLGFKKTWLEEKFAEHYIRDVQLRQINDLSHILNKIFYAAFIREPLLEIAIHQEVTFDKLPSEMQTAISNHPRAPLTNFEWSYKPPEIIYKKYIKVDSLPAYRHIFYRIKTVSSTTAILEPVKAKQENSIFLRKHRVCNSRYKREIANSNVKDNNKKIKIRKKRLLMTLIMPPQDENTCMTHILYSQGYWRVAGSTLREDGEEFTSPIKIIGGLAGLMLNNRHPDLSEQNLLINFNSCFGDTTIIGGPFLKDKLAYVLISNLMMENLLDPLLHLPITKFSFNNTKNLTNNITYIVSQNYHPSEITDDAKTIHIVLLPINFKSELDGLRSQLDKATFSTTQSGSLYLGEIGPRFIGLDTKKRIIINFHKDYSLSGEVAIKTKNLQLEQVRGNITNPANFLLTKDQNFAISLLAGKTMYQLEASKILEVTFNDTLATQGPRLTKSTKEAIFKLFMSKPLSDLAITKTQPTILVSAEVLTVQTFASNSTLSIHGYYLFKNNQTYQAELQITQEATRLTLIDSDHKQLLRDPDFFSTVKQQNLDSVNFYSSGTRSNTLVTLHSDGEQMTYQAITYRLDSEYGLVAIQGRTNPNTNSEDFSDTLTPLIDLQSNTTLPLRLNSTTIAFEERQFLNLKPNSYLLTAKGKVPIGLLPVQLPTPQQGDNIQLDEVFDLLHPSVEIDRVSLKPGVLGSSDSLMVHYRPKLRLKRTISASIAEEDAIEICFKKSDDKIPKIVVIDGKSFPIDFSELPLLNPQEPIIISHNQFEQLSHCAALQTEEVNGEILAEMRLETNKPSNQVIYRIPLNMQNKKQMLRFVNSETKQEKKLSIKLSALSKHTWQYASAGIGVAIFGAATLIAHYFKPRNNPLPIAAAALPLLPPATAKALKTMTETTTTIAESFWETATRFSEKIQGKQSNKPRIEAFTNTNKQSFFGSTSSFSSNPSSSLSDLGEQFCNKVDKSGLLQLMHFYALSRTNSKQVKLNALQTFRKAKDREQAVIIANKLVSLIKAEIKQQAKPLGISYWDLAIKIDLTKLQKNLIDAIEVGNVETVSSVLHTSIKGIKKLNLIANSDWKALEAYIDYLVDQLFFQTSTFISVKQYKV